MKWTVVTLERRVIIRIITQKKLNFNIEHAIFMDKKASHRFLQTSSRSHQAMNLTVIMNNITSR